MKKRVGILFIFVFAIFAIIFFASGVKAGLTCGPNEVATYNGCSGYYYNYSEPTGGGQCLPEDPNTALNKCILNNDPTSCRNDPDGCYWDQYYASYSCSGFNESECSANSECTVTEICSCPVGYSYQTNGTTYECSGTYPFSGWVCEYIFPPKRKTSPVCYGLTNTTNPACESLDYCQWHEVFGSATCWPDLYPDCPTGCNITQTQQEFCLPIPPETCNDTDGGNAPLTPGTVTYNSVSHKDSCSSSSVISENYCLNGVWVSSTQGCSPGTSCVTNANGEGFCNQTLAAIPNCQPCSTDSDCLSGSCKLDISGTYRCVPSDSTCALNTNSSCGVPQGFQQCYPDSTGNVKTCSSNGGWSTIDCGGFGCNQTTSTTATCKAEVKNTWWGLNPSSPCIYATNPDTASHDNTFALVLRNGTSGIFNIFKNGGQINTSSGTSSTCGTDSVWVGSWTFLANSLNAGESANYSFTINGNQSDNLTITRTGTGGDTYCGDGIVQSPNTNGLNEQCDGTNLTGNNCTTIGQGFTGGTLSCNSTCSFDTSQCTAPLCNNNGVCDVGETAGACPQDNCVVPGCQAENVSVCGDYAGISSTDPSPEYACNADLCNVASKTPPPAGTGQVDRCKWDATTSTCNKVTPITVNGKDVGYCLSKENPRTDDCSDGFLSYSWNSTWTWAPDNGPTAPNGDGSCSDGYLVVNGSCRYDPNKDSQDCASGSSTIACPAQVELSFFDWKNVVAAVLIIFILYVLLMKDKKRKVKKHSKKSKKK